jgi:uncharacterized Rossmann fold enzyme
MLNVCCVSVGEAYPPLYVEILYSMVRRNLARGFRGRFTVFTDAPERFADMAGVQTRKVPEWLKGWWAKLYLFSKDAFPKGERVLYFDLDTVITGGLDEIASYGGKFAILRDAYRDRGWQSSVMGWEAGQVTAIWDNWIDARRIEVAGGDQAWIERCFDPHNGWQPDFWQDLYPGKFRSYKKDCVAFVPRGTSVVFFHGYPRPHQCSGWVKDVWKVSDETLFFALNVKEDEIRRNVTHALSKPKWLEMRDGLQSAAVIIGGGPSLADDLWRVKGYQISGCPVFATNNTWKYLKENGITPDVHVMHDAREGNLPFVAPEGPCYYSSQCHPKVLDAAGDRLVCWHPHSDLCLEIVKDSEKGPIMVSGGSTVGLNAIALAYILGYRTFLLFGFDSSYAEGAHHAYSQDLNDGEMVFEVKAGGKKFTVAPWMFQQAEQFLALAQRMTSLGCRVFVYGDGLIPTISRNIEREPTPADLRARSILGRLKDVPNPVGAEIGVFKGELSRELLTRPDMTLYLVDSWSSVHREPYASSKDFHATLTQTQQDHFYEAARRMVEFAGPRARIIRQDSVEAAARIPDGSLDFAFIDADHSYEGCKADIEAWLPKVKKGGYLCGHDYDNPDFPWFGVQKAVDEIFPQVELGENYTWFRRI